jgi:hypothetical protein
MTLRLLTRKYDMPPLWDGQRVDWEGWTNYQTTNSFHSKDTCTACGSTAEPAINLGLLHPLPGEKVESIRVKKLPSGRTYNHAVVVLAAPVFCLSAFRCPTCGHDEVWDKRDDSWWDLDEQDYTHEGSTDGTLPL